MPKILFFKHIADLLFPPRCLFCGRAIAPGDEACGDCGAGLPLAAKSKCPACALPKEECECGGQFYSFKKITVPFYYSGPVRRALHRFKFEGERELARHLAKYMAEAAGRDFDGIRFDLIACIPITKKQHKKRGYNQSWLLAAELGTLLGLPASQHLLLKPADIKPQHSLNAKERQANVLDAFCVQSDADVAGKTILLCDDIKTTGATLNEGAKTLLAAGAAEVYAVCAAAVRQTGYRA